MKNKKFSAILLVMAMILSLVVPVQAADTVYLLTNNAVIDADAEAFAAQTGIGEYETTDGTVTIVENNGAGASIEPPADASTLFNGYWYRNGTWSRWGTNFDATIDLDGTADLEKFIFWVCTNRASFSATEEEFWADIEANGVAGSTYVTHQGDLISKYEVQISEDGVAWDTIETNEAPAFTKDNLVIEKADNGNVINTFFRFEVDLEEAKAARYIRLALNRGANQVRVSEIAAFGKNYEKFEIVPETSKVVLTQNTFSVETLSRIAKLSGQKVYAYPTEGYVPTVTATTNGFCERNSDIPAMFDGTISDQAWSVWGGAGQSLDMIIDLGGTQVVEEVVYWNNATGTDQSMKLVYSDNLWEEYKDTFDFASIAVSTSNDGKAWTEQVAPTAPATATADSTWFQGPSENIDRVLHAHVVTLPEAVSARFVKVTVKEKDGDYQFRSGEVAVLGDATAKPMYDVLSAQTTLSDEALEYMGEALDGEVQLTGKYSPAKMVVTDTLETASADSSTYLQNGTLLGERKVCANGWGSGTNTVTIDLGAVQEVSNVFVWNHVIEGNTPGKYNDNTAADFTAVQGTNIKSITVSTSEDGETYSAGETFTTGATRDESEVWFDAQKQRVGYSYQCDLAEAVNARYITLEMPYNYHADLGEIVVVGKRINDFTKNIVSGQTNVYEAGKSNLASYYADMGITLGKVDSTATIKYDDADVDNPGRDSSLSDSFITLWTGPTGGSEATSTKWAHSPVNMYVTFDQEVLVNGVDVWCTDEDPYRYTNSIDIYTSADGTEWELVGSANNTFAKATGGQYQNYISFTCEPVKTKFLRVDAIRGRYQNVIGEVIVFGELPPAPPSATTPVFWTGDSEWEYGDQSAISAVTSTITGGEGILVLAAYNAVGALSNVWTATGKGDVSIDFDEDEMYDLVNEYDSFKAFAIKSFDDMYPLGTYSEVDLGK